MGIFLESSLHEVLCLLLVILWSIYNNTTKNYGYWKKRGIPFVKPYFPFGSLSEIVLGKYHLGEGYDSWYKKFNGEPFFGIFHGRAPCLVIRDPDLIKNVMVKDFNHFIDRVPMKGEPIFQHLFNQSGSDWKRMRFTLGPTFTRAKVKMMFDCMDKCCGQLLDYLDKQCAKNRFIDIKDILARLTMDMFATCAFGLEINSLHDTNCEFYIHSSKIFIRMAQGILRRLFYAVTPFLSKIYVPKMVPEDTTLFFSKLLRDTVNYREKNNVERKDLLDILIKIRQNTNIVDEEFMNNGSEKSGDNKNKAEGITMEEIIAQSFGLFIAGFEASSSTASFCLYELSCNPAIQERLYQEIREVLSHHGGKVTYQALQQMSFLDQVFNETLRLYPTLPILNRTCTEPYQVPGSHLVIEKGVRIIIPAFSLHHDPEYFPDPDRFDPDRFTAEGVGTRHPYVHLPFGEGPRMCIAMRFGLLQTKIALATMLYNYKFDITSKTEIAISIMKKVITTLPEKPLYLRIEKREKTPRSA